jgi:hypothetical protein
MRASTVDAVDGPFTFRPVCVCLLYSWRIVPDPRSCSCDLMEGSLYVGKLLGYPNQGGQG